MKTHKFKKWKVDWPLHLLKSESTPNTKTNFSYFSQQFIFLNPAQNIKSYFKPTLNVNSLTRAIQALCTTLAYSKDNSARSMTWCKDWEKKTWISVSRNIEFEIWLRSQAWSEDFIKHRLWVDDEERETMRKVGCLDRWALLSFKIIN